MADFLITHVGDGKFEATLEDGQTKEIGPSLCGLIRFTYFEDFTVPPVGWSVRNLQLLEDYHPKVFQAIADGRMYQDPKDGMFKLLDKTQFN